jgi:L-lactate dehydrogenase complex protein LldE
MQLQGELTIMKVGLFIPCYIDQAYPQVGMAAAKLLGNLGVTTVFPEEQTCCGQPMFNSGCMKETKKLARKFYKYFKGFDYVVAPSASCVHMVTHGYQKFFKNDAGYEHLKKNTYELSEFITDVLKVKRIEGKFHHKVGFHQSCHGLRGLRLGTSSELNEKMTSKVRLLLESLEGIEIVSLSRPDECCGFGGTFSVFEEAVSSFMGNDRLRDNEKAGAEIIAGYDVSCLMHLEGLIKRNNKNLKVMHIAEILARGVS